MSTELGITVHEIATDGFPDMDALTGRVAFIFDGCIVSGWPLPRDEFSHVYKQHGYAGPYTLWEADTDVGHNRPMGGVTHWIEFPVPVWDIARGIIGAKSR